MNPEAPSTRKYKRGQHPNSRANLRPPWAPGTSGNPKGRKSFWEYLEEDTGRERKAPAADTGIIRKRGGNRCTVCQHPLRGYIDGLLVLGMSIRSTAGIYGLSASAVHRHKQHHIPKVPQASGARAAREACETVEPNLSALENTTTNNVDEVTWQVFLNLWEAFEDRIPDTPEGDFLRTLATASVWLFRLQGRGYYDVSGKTEDIQAAYEVLVEWYRG